MIYFNSASTTPIKQEVIDVITDILKNHWGNPSDKFDYGIESKRILDNSREVIANKINAYPSEIIFTSSGSAANALALNGKHCISSTIEHSSIVNNKNVSAIIKPDKNGIIHCTECAEVVSIMVANNELGTINNIKSLTTEAHANNSLIHSDCTQYFPYKKINVRDWNLDLATFSGHKFGIPSGIGFLYVKNGVELNSLISGTQEKGLFSGTENLPYIAGLAKAVELINYDKSMYIGDLRDYFEKQILSSIDNCYINAAEANRLPHISNICIQGCDSQTIQMMLSLEDICVSIGSSCESYKQSASHVLKEIGMTEPDIYSCLRFSFSEDNTKDEVDYVIKVLKDRVQMLRAMNE